jgi:hypothetical protein
MKEGTTVCCPVHNGPPTRPSVREFQTEVKGRESSCPGLLGQFTSRAREGYDPPARRGWCYIDEVVFDPSDRPTLQDGPIPRFY